MVNHKEILRLKSLGLTHREITDATGCGRNTVTRTLARAREQKLSWPQAQSMSQQEVSQRLFPTEQKRSRKFPSGYFQPSKRTLSTRCRTMSGCTERCRRAASP